MTASAIEWTGRSDWNPVRGCTRASQGCTHCYAEQIAGRFSDPGQPFHTFATRTAKGARWTGRVELMEDRLTLPLRWRKPATVFVNSTSDIFHESLPDEAIDRIFAVMALAPQHIFQVLTKRAERMREYFSAAARRDRVQAAASKEGVHITGSSRLFEAEAEEAEEFVSLATCEWPLPNVHLGVSVEDQAAADERVPHLLATPAALRFLSCEPLLGPVNLNNLAPPQPMFGPLTGYCQRHFRHSGHCDCSESQPRLHWVIAGGESGRGARPMHPDWARALRDQCAADDVPFFFKQWGEWLPIADRHLHGFNPWSMIDHLEARDGFFRPGKRRAGRLLDGRTHNGVPA